MINDRPKALPFQREGVRKIESLGGRTLLADEMGLGKTLQALWYHKRNPSERPRVVVCPANVKQNWANEAVKVVGSRAMICDGKQPITKRLMTQPDLIIINYDILDQWVPWLRKQRPIGVILDECHNIQNRSTNRTKSVRKLCKGIREVLAMSATPLTNKPAELWPALNILWPDVFPMFTEFAFRYAQPVRRHWGWTYNGSRNESELHQLLLDCGMIRRRFAEVMHELPPKTRRVVKLRLEDPDGLYHAANNDFLGWLNTVCPARARKAKKAEAVTKLGYLKRLAAKLKYKTAAAWVDRWLEEHPGEKIVLLAVHKKCIRALHRRYGNMSVVLDGGSKGQDRDAAVRRFQTDRRCRVFIGNIQAAGVGITLTAAASLAFFELDWRPAMHNQGEGRIYRITQTRPTTIYYLIAPNTIEERLSRVISEKQRSIDHILDGVDDDSSSLDVIDLLLSEMKHV